MYLIYTKLKIIFLYDYINYIMNFSFLKDAFELTTKNRSDQSCDKKCSLQENFTSGETRDIINYLQRKSENGNITVTPVSSQVSSDPFNGNKSKLTQVATYLAGIQKDYQDTVDVAADLNFEAREKIQKQINNYKSWAASLEAEIAELESTKERKENEEAIITKDINDFSKIGGTSDQELEKLKKYITQSKSRLNDANDLLKGKVIELARASNDLMPTTNEYTRQLKETNDAIADTDLTREEVAKAQREYSVKNQEVDIINNAINSNNASIDEIEANITEKEASLKGGNGAGYFDFRSLIKTLDNKQSLEKRFFNDAVVNCSNGECGVGGRVGKLYDKHTRLSDKSDLVELPTKMLLANQNKERHKNATSIQKIKTDLSSSTKNIQIKDRYICYVYCKY